MAIKDIKEVNNFLRCKDLRGKIEKLSTIKDYEIAKWADIGFAKDAGLNLGDYLEIIRLLICLKLRNLHEDNLEQLLNIKDITVEEFEAFAELSLMGYCNNKNSEVIKAAKEILDILQIKWVEEKEREITVIKIVKED